MYLSTAGLGIRSSVSPANRSFFVSERAKMQLARFLSESHFCSILQEHPERIAQVRILKKDPMSKEQCEQFAIGYKKV